MKTGPLRLETEKIPYDTKYASSVPFGQTTESQQACLSQQSVPPAPPTTFHKRVNLIPITRSLYVLVPRPGMLFPSLLAKAAPLFSPKIQQKHYLFRVSSPRPIPDCLPSYNHIDYSLVHLDGPLVSEVCTSLWPVSP